MKHLLLTALSWALLGAAGCTGGVPPGFSAGDAWVFPLVGPLESGVLITPVMIGDRGPYLFMIDPDASASSLDERVAGELGLETSLGPRLIDESDTSRPTRVAEVPALTLGTLTVRNRVVTLHPVGAFATDGRDVRGVLGRDVIADSLVFGFDRDGGIAFLATRDAFTPPATALRIPYRHEVLARPEVVDQTLRGPTGAVPRRVATVKVNDTSTELHLDLGAVPSQLATSRWKRARLAPVPYKAVAIDELATTRVVDRAGIANHVEAGGATAMGLTMIPYGDRRFDDDDVEGTLGLDFFAPYKVWADWHGRTFYLVPRDGEVDDVGPRLARWNAPGLEACTRPACASARLDGEARAPATTPPSPQASMPPDTGSAPVPPPTLVVERSAEVASIAYELLLEAVGPDGRSLGLPRLVVTFPARASTVRQTLSPSFAGASFRVLDMSPFVRPCPRGGGCVFELAPVR